MLPDTRPVGEADRHAWSGSITYADPREFPEIDVGSLAVIGGGLGILPEPPFVRRHFLRYAPEFIDDPDGCGLFKGLGPSVYGAPPAFVAAADNAALVGYRTLITQGRFFNDELYTGEQRESYLSRLSQHDPFPNEDTRLRRQPDSNSFVLEQNGRHWRRFKGPVIVLCSTEPSNYGSFLFRVLPKAHAVRRLKMTNLPAVCFKIGPTTTTLLEMAGLRADCIMSHDTAAVTLLDRAIIPALRNPDAMLDHESRAVFRQIRIQYGGSSGGKRLYISRLRYARQTGSGRVMLNEEELIARLLNLGFDIVEPETLPARQQVALFSSAEIIVGPAGSGLFNVVFCQPGTKIVDIESENHWIYAHAGLFASCELRWGIFVGQVDATDPRGVHRRWTVNIDALVDRIQSFLHT